VLYYNRSEGEGKQRQGTSPEDAEKKVKKPLDKPPQMCYNKGTKRERGKAQSPPKKLQKNKKKGLTNSAECAIIRVSMREAPLEHKK
jgi:hypothetical protein